MTAKIKKFSVSTLFIVLLLSLFAAFGYMGVSADVRTASVDDFNDSAYYKNGGASVRTNNPIGIRFFVLLEKEVYDQILTDGNGNIKDGVSTGTLIIPTDVLSGGELTKNTETVRDTVTTHLWTECTEDTDFMQSVVYLYDIPAASYNRSISYRGYVTVDGTTYYTQNVSGSERTAATVMLKAYKEDTTNDANLLAGVNEVVGKTTAISVTKTGIVKRLNDVDDSLKFVYNENSKYSVEDNFTVTKKGATLEISFTNDVQALEVQLENGLSYTVTADETGKYARKVIVSGVDKDVKQANSLGEVDLSNNTMTLSLADDLGLTAEEIAEITNAPSVKVGSVVASNVTLSLGTVTAAFENGKPYDNQTVKIEFEDYIIETDGLFITKVITTAEELLSLQTLAGGRDADTDAYGGYFVLGNSIDLASTKVSATPDTLTTAQAYYRDNARGFQGTFDGRGYVIANGIYDGDGLFGTVGKDGVVKNVGFYNAVLYQEAITGGGILAKKLMGTVENVYVRGYVFDNIVNTVGMIAGTTYGATVKNSVFVVDFSTRRANNVIDSGALVGFNAASGHGSSAAGLVNTYENVYVVMSTDKRMGGLSLGVFGSENAQTYTGNVITYLQSDTDMAFSGLDTELFKTGTDGIPYFAEEDNFFDTTYTVNHYVRTASNPSAYTIRETVVKKGVAGSSVTDYGRGYADRWFGGNNSNVYPSGKADAYKGTVLADGTLTLDVYYYNAYDIVFNAGERKSSTLLLEVNGNPRDGSVVLDYVGEYEGRSNVWQYYTSSTGGNYALGLRNGGTIGNYEYLEFKVYSTALQDIDFCIMPKNGSGLTNVYINNTTHITNQSESIKFFMNGEELTEGYEGSGWVTVRYYGQGTSNNSIRLGGRGKTTFYITDFVCGPTV